jgi:hypothetical protein
VIPGWAARVAAICIATVIAGCAIQPETQKETPQDAERIVGERAQARWTALVTGKLSEAYKFYSPSTREIISYEDFIRSVRVGFWKSAEVSKVVCSGEDNCDAHVTIEYSFRGSLIKSPLSETWIRKDGTWWYIKKG